MSGKCVDGSPNGKELKPPVDTRRVIHALRSRDITPVKPAYLCESMAIPRVNELITEQDHT